VRTRAATTIAIAGKINNRSLNFAARISATLRTQPRHFRVRGFHYKLASQPMNIQNIIITVGLVLVFIAVSITVYVRQSATVPQNIQTLAVSQASTNTKAATTVASTASTTATGMQSNSDQVSVINPGTREPIPADQLVDCRAATPIINLEGNQSVASKSATHVYDSSCDLFVGANPKTFVALDLSYAKDGDGVWYYGAAAGNTLLPPTKIEGADPATFTPIADLHAFWGFSSYAKDKNHVYIYANIVGGADPATFTIDDPPKETTVFGCVFDAHDANNLYRFGGRLPAQCRS
jgi:hypothetical protein